MPKMLEIRWHGRGGQGAKTAALLFADAALSSGKYIQAFSEYGPERTGAPVAAYDRLADEPITVHCGVTAPQVVVILDPTLIGKVDVTKGLPEDGKLIVNTRLSPGEMRSQLKLNGRTVFTVDASGISRETLGRDMPNTPLVGAVARVTGVMKLEEMLQDNREKLAKKFRNKPEVIEGNLKAIERAYKEVVSE
jgi:pyruvate ferredoxin oxidoreductase gamma subunit